MTLNIQSTAEVEETFKILADEWRKETRHLSSSQQIAMHPAYQRIIEMGPQVVPLILRDLRDYGGSWYTALKAITGVSLIPTDAQGDVRRMREVWLNWGREYMLKNSI